jgi:hypothetical protein
VLDLAGNGATSGTSPLGFLSITKRSSALVFPSLGMPDAPHTWGAVSEVSAATTTECRPGKTCLRLGTFASSYCGGVAGLATRLVGSGDAHLTIHAVGSTTSMGGVIDFPPWRTFVKAYAVAPGTDPLPFPSFTWVKTAPRTYEVPWVTLTTSTGGTSTETGVAVLLGSNCSPTAGGPMNSWITLYVEQIDVAP